MQEDAWAEEPTLPQRLGVFARAIPSARSLLDAEGAAAILRLASIFPLSASEQGSPVLLQGFESFVGADIDRDLFF